MEDFEHKSLVTAPEDLTYSYYLSPGFHQKLDPNVPTLMFLHGYPDYAYMWEGAMPHMLEMPYPIIIPDLLGFGGSSKPTDPSKYNYLQQANSLAQILDKEGVPNNVIPIGHDWGSATSQRFYLYHRTRCVGLCLLSLAYQVPSPDPFDLDEQNKLTAQRFGYPQWKYWEFFTSPDAPKLMKENVSRFFDVNHGLKVSNKPEEKGRDIWMREMFCEENTMREYVTGTGRYAGYTVPMKPYAEKNPKLRQDFIERMTRDGFEGPVCYYHSLKNNTMLDEERALCTKPEDKKINVPLLFIGQTGDWVCRTDLMVDAKKQGLVPDLEERVIQGGHWILYEKPEQIAALIKDWLLRRFPVKPFNLPAVS